MSTQNQVVRIGTMAPDGTRPVIDDTTDRYIGRIVCDAGPATMGKGVVEKYTFVHTHSERQGDIVRFGDGSGYRLLW